MLGTARRNVRERCAGSDVNHRCNDDDDDGNDGDHNVIDDDDKRMMMTMTVTTMMMMTMTVTVMWLCCCCFRWWWWWWQNADDDADGGGDDDAADCDEDDTKSNMKSTSQLLQWWRKFQTLVSTKGQSHMAVSGNGNKSLYHFPSFENFGIFASCVMLKAAQNLQQISGFGEHIKWMALQDGLKEAKAKWVEKKRQTLQTTITAWLKWALQQTRALFRDNIAQGFERSNVVHCICRNIDCAKENRACTRGDILSLRSLR